MSACGANGLACSARTPISASVCGMPISRRSSSTQASTPLNDRSASPSQAASLTIFASIAVRFHSSTYGITTAFVSPWCVPRFAEHGWLRLCMAPSPFWNAVAPIDDAISMWARASSSPPFATARGR